MDDDAAHNLALAAILVRAGFEVVRYTNARAALPVIASGCNCVITDYQMPEMNGVELIRARGGTFPACC